MSTAIPHYGSSSVHYTTTTLYNNDNDNDINSNGNAIDFYNNHNNPINDVVTRVDSVIIGTISSSISHYNNHYYNNDSSSSNSSNNSSSSSNLMGNTSMEETNPRLVNGVVNLLFMLFNIGGNGLVLYIYHSLFRNTVFNLFVKALASLDLLTAVTTMLIDVIMKMRNNHEDVLNTSVMCKLSHFQVYANSMTSGCVLTLIAYQRYTKICHPLQRGMQLRQAKILLVSIGFACLVISIPTLFLYGSRQVKVLVRSTVVQATICRVDQSYQDTPLNLIFYYVLMVAFCFVLTSICVLYLMVSRSIRKFENRSSAILNPPSSPISPSADARDAEGDDEDTVNARFPLRTGDGAGYRNSPLTTRTIMTSPVHGRNAPQPIEPIRHDPYHYHNQEKGRGGGGAAHTNPASPHSPYCHHHHHNNGNGRNPSSPTKNYATAGAHNKKATDVVRGGGGAGGAAAATNGNNGRKLSTFTMATTGNVISTQMYRVFSIITVVFIISYLPHLVALILTKVLDLDDKVLTHGQRIALEFAYNCPYIGTVSNPIIYGFSSGEFRDRVREMLQSCDVFCCCCWCCCCCCGGDRHDSPCCCCCDVFDCCDEYTCCNEDY